MSLTMKNMCKGLMHGELMLVSSLTHVIATWRDKLIVLPHANVLITVGTRIGAMTVYIVILPIAYVFTSVDIRHGTMTMTCIILELSDVIIPVRTPIGAMTMYSVILPIAVVHRPVRKCPSTLTMSLSVLPLANVGHVVLRLYSYYSKKTYISIFKKICTLVLMQVLDILQKYNVPRIISNVHLDNDYFNYSMGTRGRLCRTGQVRCRILAQLFRPFFARIQ